MVDEADNFKNLMVVTKMTRVRGISTTAVKKSSDLYMKCKYIDEITGERGVVFATGTPISNSMTEMYVMQKYLQGRTLREAGLAHFDAWAGSFGELVTEMELKPEGTGFRQVTRFGKFHNLSELISMFHEVADIKTAEEMELPRPEIKGGKPELKLIKPSEFQKQQVAALGERADAIRGGVDPREDNMLKVTGDGRKLALDERLAGGEDREGSKVNVCVETVYEIWEETKKEKKTQIIFCDLSTPKPGEWSVYDDIRQKLTEKGIPKDEVAFIHEYDTAAKKDRLYAKMRRGTVRVLLGSTAKCGVGLNVQKKLVALHHLDCPWRPRDMEQRNGRGLRQGNENSEVRIVLYAVEGTFDTYN